MLSQLLFLFFIGVFGLQSDNNILSLSRCVENGLSNEYKLPSTRDGVNFKRTFGVRPYFNGNIAKYT